MNRLFRPLLACLALLALTACGDLAKSNVKLLQTTDCGVTWKVIPAGERAPTQRTNSCGYNTVVPDFPMQGDTEFLTQFQGNILVRVKAGYDYEIVEPIKFIQEAKFLGRPSNTAAEASSIDMGPFEVAENMVIDIQLRELTTSATLTMDIVTFNPSKFEDDLFARANKVLEARGVKLKTMTFVTIPEDQTRMAIDAATAMSVYRSKGMEQLGQQLVLARAAATQVHVHTATAAKK